MRDNKQAVKDGIALTALRPATEAAVSLLDRLQHLTPAVQTLAPAILFLMACRRFKLYPPDVLQNAERRIDDALGPSFLNNFDRNTDVAVIREYFEKEI